MTKMTMERLKTDIDAADLKDNVKMQELQNTIWRKENLQRQEKERENPSTEYRATLRKRKDLGSSHCSSVQINLTSSQENTGSIPGLAQ